MNRPKGLQWNHVILPDLQAPPGRGTGPSQALKTLDEARLLPAN